MKLTLTKVAACWVLATTTLLGTVAGTDAHIYKRVAAQEVAGTSPVEPLTSTRSMQRHPRQLLSDILDALNPNRDGRADSDSETDTATGNIDSTPTDNTDTTPTEDTSSSESSSETSRSSRTSPTSESESSSRTSDRESETSETSRTSERSSTRESSSESSETSETSERSSKSSETSSKTSPTPTKSSSLVIVTVTRTGSTITTFEPEAPTIDQANGEKADVGTSENLTTIIAAPVATAVALMLFAILYYLHKRRRNRIKYSDDDTFSKAASNPVKPYAPPNRSSESSPFNLRTHQNDGYKTEPDFGGERRDADGYHHPLQQVPSDSTSLLPNPQFQQQAQPNRFAPMGAAAVAGAGAGAAAMYGVHQPQQRPPQHFQQQQQQRPVQQMPPQQFQQFQQQRPPQQFQQFQQQQQQRPPHQNMY